MTPHDIFDIDDDDQLEPLVAELPHMLRRLRARRLQGEDIGISWPQRVRPGCARSTLPSGFPGGRTLDARTARAAYRVHGTRRDSPGQVVDQHRTEKVSTRSRGIERH